jgi:predicted nucleic acid-binding protein
LNNKLKVDTDRIEDIYNKLNKDYILIEDHYFYDDALNKTITCHKRLPFFDFVFMSVMEDLGICVIDTFDEHFDLNKKIKRIY